MAVLPNARIRVIYWWNGALPGLVALRTALDGLFQGLPATHYYDKLAQYGVSAPTWVGSKVVPYSGPAPLDKTDLQGQIPIWVEQGIVSPGELLVVFCQPGLELTHDRESSFPNKTYSVFGISLPKKQFAAYHGHEDSGTGVNFAAVAWPSYLVGPLAGQNGPAYAASVLDTFTPLVIHEVVEAVVDPSTDGNEIGDPCQFSAPMRAGRWSVQKYWSDEDNGCVPHGWYDWVAVGAPPNGGLIKGEPAVYSRQPTICDVFVHGSDDRLWQATIGNSVWQQVDPGNPADASFKLLFAPCADSMGPEHVQLFAHGFKGATDDPQVYQKYWSSSGGWSPWIALGGKIRGRPTARSRQSTICDVFAHGLNDQLWQRSFNGINWQPDWQPVDPGNPADGSFKLLGAPTADSMGPDHVQLFANGTKGTSHDPQVYQKYWTASGGWSPWIPLGGRLIGSPAVRSRQSTICDVFGEGVNGKLWQRSYSGQGWQPNWQRVDPGNPFDASFKFYSAPTADAMRPEHVQLFAFGTKPGDSTPQVYQKYWT
jgi:hypothetical protein